MEELLQQVKILTDTLNVAIERMEVAFKLFSERAQGLEETSETLRATQEALEVTNEALMKSLSENDQALSDLATITAAQTVLQQKLEQQAGS